MVILPIALAAAVICGLTVVRLAAPTVLGPHGLWVAQRLAGMLTIGLVLPERWRGPAADQ